MQLLNDVRKKKNHTNVADEDDKDVLVLFISKEKRISAVKDVEIIFLQLHLHTRAEAKLMKTTW